jgi:hypothetical protein
MGIVAEKGGMLEVDAGGDEIVDKLSVVGCLQFIESTERPDVKSKESSPTESVANR